MKDLLVWVRLGDTGEYESHENPHIAGLHVREVIGSQSIKWNTIHWREGGITCDSYQGNNYISIFWGDEECQWLSNFNESDKLDFLAGLS